jgi:hypothetical protein
MEFSNNEDKRGMGLRMRMVQKMSETKKDIIDNFIIFFTSSEIEREEMRTVLEEYLKAEKDYGYDE